MKKTIFAVIIVVAIISSVITGIGMNVYNAHKKDLVDLTNEIAYRYNAKEVHEEAMQRMDTEASANNYTGIASVSAKCGTDTLTWNACYINGSRVDAEEFNTWIYDITDEYADALSNAEDTIEEQDDRLSNITLSDWLECKFN